MSVVVHYDILTEHGKHIDIYEPHGSGPFPVVICVHGGAWIIGSKSYIAGPAAALAEYDLVCVAPNYTLTSISPNQISLLIIAFGSFMAMLASGSQSTEEILYLALIGIITTAFLLVIASVIQSDSSFQQEQHPQHIYDLQQTIIWIIKHITEFKGNPDLLFLLGHSAGAHLAALLTCNRLFQVQPLGERLATNVRLPTLLSLSLSDITDDQENIIKGCVGISGVYSDKRLSETQIGQKLLKTIFGNRSHYFDAFPIYHISDTTPPFLLMNAENDYTLKRHSFDFHYALLQNGTYSEICYYEHTNHATIMTDWKSNNKDIPAKISSFIHEIAENQNVSRH